MEFYDRHVMPWLIDKACALSVVSAQRQKVVPRATGVVMEVGIGSGLNLPYYDPNQVSKIIGVDPDDQLWKRSARRRSSLPVPVERIGLSGERIALPSESADTVVVTYSLCTIPDPVAALTEMRRILKSGGELLFLEHGEAPSQRVRKWQRRIDPVWKKLAGGCHSGRPIPNLLEEAGWKVHRLEEAYIPGPKVLAYNYWGAARP